MLVGVTPTSGNPKKSVACLCDWNEKWVSVNDILKDAFSTSVVLPCFDFVKRGYNALKLRVWVDCLSVAFCVIYL